MKVSEIDYKYFKAWYDSESSNKNSIFYHQRLGQAFINMFHVYQYNPDPTLFYEVDSVKANELISKNYISG